MIEVSEIPSKSLLCSKEVSGDGLIFKRKYLYSDANLPPLQSPTLSEIQQCVSEMNVFHSKSSWNDLPRSHKLQIIRKSADVLSQRASLFAELDAIETGRSYQSLLNDSIPKAIETIRWFCSALEVTRQSAYETGNNSDIAYSKRIPYGICLSILPWNDPMVLFAWKVIPALLLGNSVIVKPSEYSSGSALAYAQILFECGLPKKALSVVVGRDSGVFEYLVSAPEISVVSMTGSTKTALYIQNIVSKSGILKKLNFECGGKSPFLISKFNSPKNLNKACKVLVDNMFYNQGQICSAPSVLTCEKSDLDTALTLVLDFAQAYVPGNPLSDVDSVGTMCIQKSVQALKSFINQARFVGAKVLQLSYLQHSNKHVSIPPTILIVEKELYFKHDFLRQELFGPILTIVAAANFDEMIEVANSSDYGLASSLWSESLGEIQKASSQVEAGILHINCYGVDSVGIPFGGIKNSGEAKEKSLETFDQFSYCKTIYLAS